MPLPSLIKPILLTTSIVVGASVALYETNPNIRHFIDTAALKLSHVFQDILTAIDEGIRNLSPEQREANRRRQRERVSMVAMSGRGTPTPYTGPPSQADQSSSRSDANAAAEVGVGASNASGRDDLKAKRRRLWELAEAAPPYAANDPAGDGPPALPARTKNDFILPAPEKTPLSQDVQKGIDNNDDGVPGHTSQPAAVAETTNTAILSPQRSDDPIPSAAQPQPNADAYADDDTWSTDSPSLIPTPPYSPSLSATPSSQPPSPAPEDLVDTLSSADDDDGASTDTETMSHVSAYSLGSGNGGGWDADAVSVTSSEAGDWEEARGR